MACALFSMLLVCSQPAVQTDTQYPVFETDKIPISQLKARREAIKSQLGPGGVAILFTNPIRNRNNDVDFRFRGDSNFLYLTGFEEPESFVILSHDSFTVDHNKVTEVLFVNENNPTSLTWQGYRMGSKDARSLLGMGAVLSNSRQNFLDVLKAIESIPHVRIWSPSTPPDPTGTILEMRDTFTEWLASHADWAAPSESLGPILGKMRVKKSPEEIALLRHAAHASAMGHREVLRSVQPGMRESELQAVVEYVYARNGCEYPGYPSIVGSGPNSCILHYEDDRRKIQNGDMICMDAAGEYHGYSADITRSFPANGKFSPAQREIYEIVLAAQTAGIAQCRPGNSFFAPGRAAEQVVQDGLLRLGIIKNRSEDRIYLPHGVSHYVGLDVHDSFGDSTLRPGYELTVEPGIYIREGSKCDPKYWNIGIRIEDDVLITEKGAEVLSAAAPRQIAEIEALMKQGGIGKKPVGE